MRDILSWVAAVELLGVAVLPLLRAFFSNRRDAALLSRPIGLALVAYVAWASTLVGFPFERWVAILAFLAVALCSYLVQRKAPRSDPQERFWGQEEKRAAILFWASAGVFLLIRGAVPEVVGQEKFMDLAFLNSLAHHTSMPPPDPWMSGRTINYYYWGYLLAAALTKFSGVPTLVAYNLAVATFAGFSFVAAVCLGMRLTEGKLAAGIAAGFGAVFAGNLSGALDGWNYLIFSLTHGAAGKDFNYFQASRVIGLDPNTHDYSTISEFPFFTFFQADLHPHLLGFPYFIAAFAVAHRFLTREPSSASAAASGFSGHLRRWSPALLFALVAGTSIAANLWTLPAVGILIVAVCAFRNTRGKALPTLRDAGWRAAGGVFFVWVAYALFLAYEASYSLTTANPSAHGLARTTQNSGLIEFLAVWAILLAVAVAALWPASPQGEAERRRLQLELAAALAASLLIALLERKPALAAVLFVAYLAARAGWTSLSDNHDSSEIYASLLVLLGLAMVAGCEFVYLKDTYGDKNQRMNTIFKFYHQAWPLLAIGVAVFTQRAWKTVVRRRVLVTVGVAAIFLGLLYPAAATIQRLAMRQGPFTLDARPALERRNPDDAAAIAWLSRNASRNAIVLEATGDPYSEYARISTHTGIPTIMGWANHEGLWRDNDKEISERVAWVRGFYNSGNPSLALSVVERYHPQYIVLGAMERRTYEAAAAVASFPFVNLVFSGGTSIYQVFGVR